MPLALSGSLTMRSVPSQLRNLQLPADGVIDLSGVTQSDSSALALLLEIQRRAAGKGLQLQWQGAPQQLLELARFFELDEAIALRARA